MADLNPITANNAQLFNLLPPLKIAFSGELTLNSSSSTVTHNLGYIPVVKMWAYQKSSTELSHYQQIANTLLWPYSWLSTPDVTFYTTTTTAVFTNSVNGPITVLYRIYYND